jgi:hypothetical protein
MDVRSKTRSQSALNINHTINPVRSSNTFGIQSNPTQRRSTGHNYANATSSMLARDNFGGYSQHMGTITQNGLRLVDGLLHSTTS